jgi:glycosyltransferase involved in cell wall biosynthesis
MRAVLETRDPDRTAELPTYVLVTPARNEESFIERTIKSVVGQTIRPLRWVIVSDGSTDRTDEIAQRYAAAHDWIEFVRMPKRNERHFAGKVHAFAAGAARVRHLPYQIIGNLDADVSFDADYVEYLLGKFAMFPRLGVTGTNQREEFWQARPRYNYWFTSIQEVPGPCQLFRRECLESIGGYTANPEGGVDLLANLRARMRGWETRVYTGRLLIHQRKQGTAQAHPWFVEFHNGRKDYVFGGHPLWQIFRAAYNLTKKPYVIGGCLMFAGYFTAVVTRRPKVFADDVVRFRRKEQMSRLRAFLRPSAWRRPDHD